MHIDPENDETNKPSLGLPNRADIMAQLEQHWRDLPGYQQIEDIRIHYFNGQIYLEVCWPPNAVTLKNGRKCNVNIQQIRNFYRIWLH